MFYNTGCGSHFRDAVISVGQSLSSWTTCGTFKGPGTDGQRISIKCPAGTRGRYLQVQVKGQHTILVLNEVEVYGGNGESHSESE
jgi:hypothetical protein